MKASLWEITFVYTACKTLKGFRAESFFAEAFSLKYFTDFSKFFSNACFKKWMQNQILNRKNIFVIVFPEIRFSFVIHLKILVRAIATVLRRDGTGQNFLDPSGKFQNLRRLTVFLEKVFAHCSMHPIKNFQKGGSMGDVLKFVTP